MGGIYFLALSIVLSAIAMWEFYTMFKDADYSPLKFFPILISASAIICNYYYPLSGLYVLLSGVILIFSLEIFRKEKKNPFNTMISVFGLVYICIPFICLNSIMNYKNFNYIIFTFILIWTCDTMAFFGGKFFGRHKLSEISPKKTWEGSASGLLFTLLVSYLFYYFSDGKLSLTDAIVFGLIIGIFSQIGDLFESLFKRKLNVKDSSDIIPGHGGVLDRFDSLIFVAPLIFVYLVLTKFFI
jgi:phosphatidate cytidylyltransferase